MPRRTHSNIPFLPRFPLVLLLALLALLWLAGGASRPDVIGQVVIRGGTWAILIILILFGDRPRWQPVMPVALFVAAAIALAALQLIPLPPSLWTVLPGRELLAETAIVAGQEQPWRPLSISPAATLNALSSLVVPLVMLLLLAGLNHAENRRIVPTLLILILASSLIGLLQFSGTHFDHPMVNDIRGEVSGSFANRNHFALFVAIGCPLALVWAFHEGQGARWKAPVALALLVLFGLTILATGSRTGMLVGVLGIVTGLLVVRRQIVGRLRRLPRWGAISLVAGTAGLLVFTVALSVSLNRAVSLERALSLGLGEDLRRQALPTIWEMTWAYFPAGTGLSTFDPAYRIAEPDALLDTQYLNHAHNDLLEVMLDAGLAGMLLLATAIAWWLWMSIRAWRLGNGSSQLLPRLGSAMLLLVLVASVTDYPARTPMIMAIAVLAAVWLADRTRPDKGAAPASGRRRGQGGDLPVVRARTG